MRKSEVRLVLLAALAWGCGSNASVNSDGSSDGSGAASGSGGAQGDGDGDSAQGSGGDGSGSAQGSGGDGSGGAGGAAATQCQTVDGQLSYGPIGEPFPWPLEAVSTPTGDCSGCDIMEEASGFRTESGYGFVWRMRFDSETSSPNLFSLNVDSSFQGAEPQALLAENALDFNVTAVPSGYAITTCSLDSEPSWFELDSDLDEPDAPRPPALDTSCKYLAPQLAWTGEAFLTSYTDARGLVVASLDEQGTLLGEEVLSTEIDELVNVRFSKNGDRMLFVFNMASEQPSQYALLDLSGKPASEVQTISYEVDNSVNLAVVANGDGWWVLNDSGTNLRDGALLTGVDREGLVWHEEQIFQQIVSVQSLKRSPTGQTLLVGSWSETGRFPQTFPLIALIDDAGEVVYYSEITPNDTGPRPIDVVFDPERDLVIEAQTSEGSQRTTVIQEYGCLP